MTFSEPAVGQTASLQKTVTPEDVAAFAAISPDANSLRLSDEFTKSSFFGKRVVHGMLTGSLISAAVANRLPGPGCRRHWQ